MRLLALCFVLLSGAYGGRLVQLQVLESDTWRALSTAQTAEQREVRAPRGGIYDRSGRSIVLDGQVYRAFLAPEELRDRAETVRAVGRVLGLSDSEEEKLLAAESGWVAIPRRISNADGERLRSVVRRGLHLKAKPTRIYPEGSLARSLLGGTDAEGRGASGLELELDSLLTGRPGAALARRDALGGTYWLPDAQLRAPQPGHDVFLTLDAELQSIAEHALERGLAETGAFGGDVLLMSPQTGEILAIASRRGDSRRSVPAFTDPYEPGSTLKPFLLSGLLSDGAARLTDTIDVKGGIYRNGRRVIRDVHPHDRLSVAEVVQYSSNVGAAKLAERLSFGTQYRYLRDFGFGVPTGIEYPAEAGGRLRRPGEWSALSQASLAMGYEISVTSLQLAAAYGSLANRGLLMRPYLVREVRDAEGRTVYERGPEPVRRVIDPQVAKQVVEVLTAVVREGTGTRAALASLPVAGKTGTARLISDGRYERRYAASFIGFAPADDPQLVILTKLEEPMGQYYGGAVAAPIIQETLQAALASRGVLLDRRPVVRRASRRQWGGEGSGQGETGPFVFAVDTPPVEWPTGAESAEPVRLPNLRGLPTRVAVARLHRLGLKVELRTTVRVSAQDPAPGHRVAHGATIVLR